VATDDCTFEDSVIKSNAINVMVMNEWGMEYQEGAPPRFKNCIIDGSALQNFHVTPYLSRAIRSTRLPSRTTSSLWQQEELSPDKRTDGMPFGFSAFGERCRRGHLELNMLSVEQRTEIIIDLKMKAEAAELMNEKHCDCIPQAINIYTNAKQEFAWCEGWYGRYGSGQFACRQSSKLDPEDKS